MRSCIKILLEDFLDYHKYEEMLKASREFNDLDDLQIE